MPDTSETGVALLVPSWILALRAERLSKGSINTYTRGVNAYLAWCTQRGDEATLKRRHVQEFFAECFELGVQATTVSSRLTALRSFSAWCFKEDEIAVDELPEVKHPHFGSKHRPLLSREDVDALLATCDTKTFLGKRDAALILLMLDSGGRAQEILSLTLDDISVAKGRALIHGKGDRDRLIPFRPQTATAIDRYLRARRKHPLAAAQNVWLGDRGRQFRYGALWKMINTRGQAAGIAKIHPHMFRRTFADNWLSAGGSTDGLMAVAGWEDMSMIKHYAGARANVRALEEHQRLFGQQ